MHHFGSKKGARIQRQGEEVEDSNACTKGLDISNSRNSRDQNL